MSINYIYDDTANVSSKDVLVNSDSNIVRVIYEVLHIRLIISTSATSGNRRPMVQILDPSGNIVMRYIAHAVVPANTIRNYDMPKGLPNQTVPNTADSTVIQAIPTDGMYILPGHKLVVADLPNIANGEDDLTVSLLYRTHHQSGC